MKMKKLLTAMAGVGLATSIVPLAHSLGDAGQTVANLATVSYQVNSTAQDPIESSPAGNTTSGTGNGAATNFVEDRLLNFTLTRVDTQEVTVTAGQNGDATSATTPLLTFTLTNTGNGCQDFTFTGAQEAATVADIFGAGNITDNFNAAGLSIFVDSVLGTGQSFGGSGTDSATFVDELCPTEIATVYVVATGTPAVPITQVNGDIAIATLTAQMAAGATVEGDATKQTGATGAAITTDDSAALDDPTAVQNVFATNITTAGNPLVIAPGNLSGSPSNGAVRAASAFKVLAAELISTKQSIVATASVLQGGAPSTGTSLTSTAALPTGVPLGDLDGATLTQGQAKRLPGAVVAYAIEVQNQDSATGTAVDAADATNVRIVDDLSALVAGANQVFETPTAAPTFITATLITENGGAVATTTAITFTAVPGAPSPGEIYYDLTTNVITGICGTLRGNDGAGAPANLDEACRLVVNLTIQ